VSEGEAEGGHVASGVVSVDRDDAEPVPDPVEGWEHHVTAHHPTDFERAGDLNEDWIDAGGVVDDDNDWPIWEAAAGREVVEAGEVEAMEEPCVGVEGVEAEAVAGLTARVGDDDVGSPSPEKPEKDGQ